MLGRFTRMNEPQSKAGLATRIVRGILFFIVMAIVVFAPLLALGPLTKVFPRAGSSPIFLFASLIWILVAMVYFVVRVGRRGTKEPPR